MKRIVKTALLSAGLLIAGGIALSLSTEEDVSLDSLKADAVEYCTPMPKHDCRSDESNRIYIGHILISDGPAVPTPAE